MIEVEESCGNVYADLGFPDAEEMLLKAKIAGCIDRIVSERKWEPQRAAATLGIPQAEFVEMLRGQFRNLPVSQMLQYLRLLGYSLSFHVIPAQQAMNAEGRPYEAGIPA